MRSKNNNFLGVLFNCTHCKICNISPHNDNNLLYINTEFIVSKHRKSITQHILLLCTKVLKRLLLPPTILWEISFSSQIQCGTKTKTWYLGLSPRNCFIVITILNFFHSVTETNIKFFIINWTVISPNDFLFWRERLQTFMHFSNISLN